MKLVTICFLLFLTGCSTPLFIAKTGADGVSYIHTGKTITDNIFSSIIGKDCSFFNLFTEKPLCKK